MAVNQDVAGSIPSMPVLEKERDEMKVYVITSGEYSDYGIRAVEIDRNRAECICATLNKDIFYDRYEIEEYDTDAIQFDSNKKVMECYVAEFDYCTLNEVHIASPFISFERNEIKMFNQNGKRYIRITATFAKGTPMEKARKIMKDRVAKWKAEWEGL